MRQCGHALLASATVFLFLLLPALAAYAQAQASTALADASTAGKPVVVTLDEAIRLAEASEPAFAAAAATSRSAGLDRSIARSGLLPNVSYYEPGTLH